MDHVTFIMKYEADELESVQEYLDGFASLIRSGTVWHLQGHYGRVAASLIEEGYISPEGDVLQYPED